MKKLVLVVLLLVIVVLLCSCSNTLTAETTEAVDADLIKIVLEENSSTGYQWEYSISDESVIEFVSDSTDSNADTDIVGASCKHTWIFRGIAEGESIIMFDYVSPSGEISDSNLYRYSIKDGVAILVDRYKNTSEKE